MQLFAGTLDYPNDWVGGTFTDTIDRPLSCANVWSERLWAPTYARWMSSVSKTVEVAATPETIMSIVADFEAYPQWNKEVKGCWILARYNDGRPSQLRMDIEIQGIAASYIAAVYYPNPSQIYTMLQQGELLTKHEQTFSVVSMGATSLLTVDMDLEPKMPIPKSMVKKTIDDVLEYLAENLKARAEQLAAGS